MAGFNDFLKDSGQAMTPVDTATPQGQLKAPHRGELSRHGVMPKADELPENERQFVNDIRDLDTYDKVQLVNSYVNGRIKFEEQAAGTAHDTRSFQDIIKDPRGDCDDYAYSKAVLLHHAGVEDVHIAGVDIQFQFEQGRTATFAHAVTMAGTGDGKYYAMDNLVEEPYEVGRDMRSVQNNLTLPENADYGPAKAQIHKVLGVSSIAADGSEQYFAPEEPKPTPLKPPEPAGPEPMRYNAPGLTM